MAVTNPFSPGLSGDQLRQEGFSREPSLVMKGASLTMCLLSTEEHHRVPGQRRTILDAISLPGLAAVEFEPPKLALDLKEISWL